MLSIFYDMIESSIDVFMDDIFGFGSDFDKFLAHLNVLLERCTKMNLVLNWEIPFYGKRMYHFGT